MNYLEDYVDILQVLPHEIQKQFTHLCEMDSISKRTDDSIAEIVTTLLFKGEKLDTDQRKSLVSEANKIFDESVRVSKEKLQMASIAYETVDKHIRRLDSDFNRFLMALAHYKSSTAPQVERESEFRTGKKSIDAFNGNSSGQLKKASTRKFLSKKNQKKDRKKQKDTEEDIDIVDSNEDLYEEGYPIDPNEPTYCHCGQVSYGEMIACDNDDCSIKWFHWECIGLKTLPKGKWFCPDCSSKKKKLTK